METTTVVQEVQEAPARQASGPVKLFERLKAERIQLLLRELPGWRLTRSGTAISRAVQLPGHRSALAFANFAAELANDRGLTAEVDVRPQRVGVTLSNRTVRGLTEAEFALAAALELRQ